MAYDVIKYCSVCKKEKARWLFLDGERPPDRCLSCVHIQENVEHQRWLSELVPVATDQERFLELLAIAKDSAQLALYLLDLEKRLGRPRD